MDGANGFVFGVMMNDILQLLSNVRPQDPLDILLLTFVIYWLLNQIKGTRTIPILMGLSVLLATYVAATWLRLDAIGWVMENLFGFLVVILVVLFQADIRTALARVGMTTMFREMSTSAQRNLIEEVVSAAVYLSKRKIGASIVMEKETGLRNYVERAKAINADTSMELLVSIFHPTSPLHDGAVTVMRDGSLAAARCILPLSANPESSAFLGTRHRSALGLSEETDAVIVVVSEERGFISLAYQGTLHRDLDEATLRQSITRLFQETETDHGTEGALTAEPRSA